MRRARACVMAAAVAALLAGCTSAAGSTQPDWQASPNGPAVEGSPGAHLQPILPLPSLTGPGSGGTVAPPSGSSGAGGSSAASKPDPQVVATKLQAPVGLAILPDGTALVGERTTGRIVRVQPVAGQKVPTVRTLRGLDVSGDGGLLDLALSPTYSQDSLVYAYITTPTDNRVVDFTLDGPVTAVFTGIPKGRTGNTGRLLFGADGDLYVGTGDAGRPALAQDARSLAGKVLRLSDIGRRAPGNSSRTAVWTSGHHRVDGLCAVPRTSALLEVETGASGNPDEVNSLADARSYGWPTATGTDRTAIATMPTSGRSPGDCAVLAGRIWITSRNGRTLESAAITGAGDTLGLGTFTANLKNTYGRLDTVVAAPDGALWLTTTNKDGQGRPVAADERVIRYLPLADSGGGQGKQ